LTSPQDRRQITGRMAGLTQVDSRSIKGPHRQRDPRSRDSKQIRCELPEWHCITYQERQAAQPDEALITAAATTRLSRREIPVRQGGAAPRDGFLRALRGPTRVTSDHPAGLAHRDASG
jgi:hypothetical protein